MIAFVDLDQFALPDLEWFRSSPRLLVVCITGLCDRTLKFN